MSSFSSTMDTETRPMRIGRNDSTESERSVDNNKDNDKNSGSNRALSRDPDPSSISPRLRTSNNTEQTRSPAHLIQDNISEALPIVEHSQAELEASASTSSHLYTTSIKTSSEPQTPPLSSGLPTPLPSGSVYREPGERSRRFRQLDNEGLDQEQGPSQQDERPVKRARQDADGDTDTNSNTNANTNASLTQAPSIEPQTNGNIATNSHKDKDTNGHVVSPPPPRRPAGLESGMDPADVDKGKSNDDSNTNHKSTEQAPQGEDNATSAKNGEPQNLSTGQQDTSITEPDKPPVGETSKYESIHEKRSRALARLREQYPMMQQLEKGDVNNQEIEDMDEAAVKAQLTQCMQVARALSQELEVATVSIGRLELKNKMLLFETSEALQRFQVEERLSRKEKDRLAVDWRLHSQQRQREEQLKNALEAERRFNRYFRNRTMTGDPTPVSVCMNCKNVRAHYADTIEELNERLNRSYSETLKLREELMYERSQRYPQAPQQQLQLQHQHQQQQQQQQQTDRQPMPPPAISRHQFPGGVPGYYSMLPPPPPPTTSLPQPMHSPHVMHSAPGSQYQQHQHSMSKQGLPHMYSPHEQHVMPGPPMSSGGPGTMPQYGSVPQLSRHPQQQQQMPPSGHQSPVLQRQTRLQSPLHTDSPPTAGPGPNTASQGGRPAQDITALEMLANHVLSQGRDQSPSNTYQGSAPASVAPTPGMGPPSGPAQAAFSVGGTGGPIRASVSPRSSFSQPATSRMTAASDSPVSNNSAQSRRTHQPPYLMSPLELTRASLNKLPSPPTAPSSSGTTKPRSRRTSNGSTSSTISLPSD